MTEMYAPVLQDVRATAPFIGVSPPGPQEAGSSSPSICEATSLVVLGVGGPLLLAGGDGIPRVGGVSGGAGSVD